MRLTGLEIHGYKALRNVSLEDLRQYNVLIGPNNAGKSSIAEVLWRIRYSYDSSIQDELLLNGPWETFYGEHVNNDCRCDMSFDVDGTHWIARLVPQRGSWLTENGSGFVHPDTFSASVAPFLRSIRYSGPYEAFHQPQGMDFQTELRRDARNLATVLFSMHNNQEPEFDSLQAAFCEVLPQFEGVETHIDASNKTTYVRVRMRGKTPQRLASLGDGVGRCLAVIAAVSTAPSASFLLIEEPEVGQHPSLQRRLKRKVMEIAGERDLQLLVLTHSPTWADVGPAAALFQINDQGQVSRATSIGDAANSIGYRPSDAGFADAVLICEGESERDALPHLAAAVGRSFISSGIHLVVAGGWDRRERIKAQIEAARAVGQVFHVALDGADCPKKAATEIAKDLGIAPHELTLWARPDGSPGEFEDVFPLETLWAALTVWGEVSDRHRHVFMAGVASSKTGDAAERVYYEAHRTSLQKPGLSLAAAESFVSETGTIPAQVSALLDKLSAAVSARRG